VTWVENHAVEIDILSKAEAKAVEGGLCADRRGLRIDKRLVGDMMDAAKTKPLVAN
jgi:hypothetical protein